MFHSATPVLRLLVGVSRKRFKKSSTCLVVRSFLRGSSDVSLSIIGVATTGVVVSMRGLDIGGGGAICVGSLMFLSLFISSRGASFEFIIGDSCIRVY